MWQSSSLRPKPSSSKKKGISRPRIIVHVKRSVAFFEPKPHTAQQAEGAAVPDPASAQSSSDAKPIEVRTLLNDLSPSEGVFFSHEKLNPGQQGHFKIKDPVTIELPCEVIFCEEVTLSQRVLHSKVFGFRIGFRWIHSTTDDVQKLRSTLDSLGKQHLGLGIQESTSVSGAEAAPPPTTESPQNPESPASAEAGSPAPAAEPAATGGDTAA
jgi:hypothetical protein